MAVVVVVVVGVAVVGVVAVAVAIVGVGLNADAVVVAVVGDLGRRLNLDIFYVLCFSHRSSLHQGLCYLQLHRHNATVKCRILASSCIVLLHSTTP